MEIQLQKPKEGTCVSCAAVNALRCHGMDAPVDDVIAALRVQRFHGRDATFVGKAAKLLRQQYGMQVVVSRPPHLIRDPLMAAYEVALRYQDLLRQGYVGIVSRLETRGEGHTVVIHQIDWRDGEPWFLAYDSNKLRRGGRWEYRAMDYVIWCPDLSEETEPLPTGRVGYFVRPTSLAPAAWPPQRYNPFRSRRAQRRTMITMRASCPPGG